MFGPAIFFLPLLLLEVYQFFCFTIFSFFDRIFDINILFLWIKEEKDKLITEKLLLQTIFLSYCLESESSSEPRNPRSTKHTKLSQIMLVFFSLF